MYFPNAFKMEFLASPNGGQLQLATSGTTANLTAGVFGLYNPTTWQAIAAGSTAPAVLACGSWHTVDKIAPFYGGLKESLKSKVINWRLVTRLIKATAQAAQNQIVSIGWNQSSGSTVGPLFYCGTTYTLKVQWLGSPALWFLDKQGYINLDAWGGCCNNDCSSGCTSTAVDAATIMLQWKDRISQTPNLTSFYIPNVYIQTSGGTRVEVFSAYDTSIGVGTGTYVPNTSNPASVISALQLTVAYQETKFGNCTFTPTDHYEIEPLILQASLVTQDADPCAYNTTINTSVPNMFTQLQAPRQVRGTGEAVLRDMIMSNRYHQDDFPDSIYVDSLRMREIQDDTAVPNVSRTALYDQLMILHTIPRPYNPSGVNDNDQYALIINAPTGTDFTNLLTIVQASLTAVGSPVTLENL